MKQVIKEFPPGPDPSIKRKFKSPKPLTISSLTKRKSKKLGIYNELENLRDDGYCIMENVFDNQITNTVRKKILELSLESAGDLKGLSAALLLSRDPIFEKIIVNKKLLTAVEFAVGKGALLSQLLGGIRPKGGGNFNIHIDSAWTPSPLPEYPLMITACLACEDFTLAAGPTKVIPSSHKFLRQPYPNEIKKEEGAIPTLCKKGSLIFWLGSTWHGNYPRLKKGERVVLHISFSRLMMRPIENYDHLDEQWLKGKPQAIKTMLGRNDFLGTTTKESGGTDRSKTIKTFNWAQS